MSKLAMSGGNAARLQARNSARLQARMSTGLTRPAVRQFVGRPALDHAILDADRRKLRQLARDLLPDPAECDAEDTLATGEEIVDLVRRRALIDAHSVAHQRHLRQVVRPVI